MTSFITRGQRGERNPSVWMHHMKLSLLLIRLGKLTEKQLPALANRLQEGPNESSGAVEHQNFANSEAGTSGSATCVLSSQQE